MLKFNNSFSLFQLKKLNNFHLKKLNTNKNPFEIYSDIFNFFDSTFIFESLSGPKELAETSIIGFNPNFTVQCNSKNFIIFNRNKKIVKILKVSEPLSQLRSILPKIYPPNIDYRYIGGAVGYISYEAIRFWERLPASKKKILNFPLLEFGIFTDGILYDHQENQPYYFFSGTQSQIENINKILNLNNYTFKNNRDQKNKNSTPKQIFNLHNIRCTLPQRNLSKSQFIQMVKKAQRYIYDGDIFQVVLSKNFKFNIEGNPLNVYSSLRKLNPSPYMYLYKIGKRCIIGSSPEMLLRVTGKVIETFPIAGTRPIGKNEEETTKLGEDLLEDEKELAEHTMLVDLARNDIGRVSDYGTVKVKSLMAIKRFSHVQHIVSHVVGHLSNNFDVFDALKALFPAGTVSGAPKVRAMEIINELEKERREPYAGALGYFSFNGCCDFAITIRSIFIHGKQGYIQSGAGIVMDSIPLNEWEETERKADAMISVLKNTNNHKRKVSSSKNKIKSLK
jgi:anthranilate synthase component 1